MWSNAKLGEFRALYEDSSEDYITSEELTNSIFKSDPKVVVLLVGTNDLSSHYILERASASFRGHLFLLFLVSRSLN